ncbi:MAG: flagellar motor protein MotB [Candidatus Sumerlaeia bacterium]
MARKKEPEKPENHERWLVSFADFMTLLFALFVVLFANSQSDTEKLRELSASFKNAMASVGIVQGGGPAFHQGSLIGDSPKFVVKVESTEGWDGGKTAQPDAQTDRFDMSTDSSAGDPDAWDPASPVNPATNDAKSGIGDPGSEEMQGVFDDLQGLLREEMNLGSIQLEEKKRGIVITLGEFGFFDSASSELKPSSLSTLDTLAGKLLKLVRNKNIIIRVEGHTDNVPLAGHHRYEDNQELSTARANSVVRRFRDVHRFPPRNLIASGYGEYYPIASNRTEIGRAKNRRVDIVLLSDSYAQQEPDQP